MGKLFLLIFFFLSDIYAQTPKFKIDTIIESSGISKSKLGIQISMRGNSIYSLNANQKFVPASLSKILTGAAAIRIFSPGQKFKTELLSDASIEGTTLKGDLYIRGGGDPSLISENMWVLVNNFRRTGITKITGAVYVDNSIYDPFFIDSSREDVRVDRAYDSPVSATAFNWNTMSIYIRPGSKEGEPVRVITDPAKTFYKIINEAKTRSANGSTLEVTRKNNEITIKGKLGIKTGEKVFYKNIDNPVEWVGHSLIGFLEERGIKVEGKNIQPKVTPTTAKALAFVEGWDIEETVSGLMRFSNNFIAEMLTKNMAIEKGAKTGTIAEGVKIIKNVLSEYGIPESSYEFKNPSGFSRDNKISPETLVKILESIRKDFLTSPGLINALAVPGVNGSLHKRMNSVDEKRWIRAKTGLLTSAVGLAGYIGNKNGDLYEFAFMYNGGGKEDKARSLFDKLAGEIVGK